ncbi:MAG: hypothetical protein LBW77_05620 [Verrucomicrobiota bacterium]|jgi:flagellar biogenesis protein FliO|nr:hypothetical protein [Verrucomicrobiota bacterium]
MCNLTHREKAGGRRSGQAAVEYIVVFVAMLGVVAMFALFLYAVRQQSNRALDLVASEYP